MSLLLLSKCDSSDDRNLSLAEVIEIKLHLLSLFSDRTTYEGFDKSKTLREQERIKYVKPIEVCTKKKPRMITCGAKKTVDSGFWLGDFFAKVNELKELMKDQRII